jgi:hypothetical protein
MSKFIRTRFHGLQGDNRQYNDGLADVVVYNNEVGNLDCRQYIYIIKEEVFLGQTLPFDLTEWLEIISQGAKACHRSLLCNHVDLMEPYQAYGQFMCMYQIFWNIDE